MNPEEEKGRAAVGRICRKGRRSVTEDKVSVRLGFMVRIGYGGNCPGTECRAFKHLVSCYVVDLLFYVLACISDRGRLNIIDRETAIPTTNEWNATEIMSRPISRCGRVNSSPRQS